MNDLLGNVGGQASSAAPPGVNTANPLSYGALEDAEAGMAAAAQPSHDKSMASFFAAVEDIKGDIGKIQQLQEEVVELHETGKTLIKTKDVKKQQGDMQVGNVGACMHPPPSSSCTRS